METRGSKRSFPSQRANEKFQNSTENVKTILRRSPRNLPAWLKEKNEEPVVQKEPDISSLPSILFDGRINYVNDFYGCAMVCDGIIQEIEKHTNEIVPIGFDLEWPFSFQTGSGKTALAQICLSDSTCYLLHIYNLKKLPAAFVVLLSHPKAKLVGVNIKNDVWKLGRDFKEFPAEKVVQNNCIDCGTFANKVLNRSCRWSLERLTAYLLRKRISKDSAVRRSKWHIQPLSDVQKTYAATDAYVSLLLHTTIQKRASELTLTELKENYRIDLNLEARRIITEESNPSEKTTAAK